MRKVKHFLYFLIIFSSLFVVFGPQIIPDNFNLQETLDGIQNSQVIIVFNSGGWGDTPFTKADDFRPVIEGIQQTLSDWGYTSFVLPYNRTKDTLLGRVSGTREFFNLFKNTSGDLAEKIENISRTFPDKKIILTGLSNSGTFVLETYKKISRDIRSSVCAITVGMPFWAGNFGSEQHFLSLNNGGKDALSEGNAGFLIAAVFQAPFRWIDAKIQGRELSFSQAFHVSGHGYSWSSSQVSQTIVAFLNEEIR